MKKMIIILYLLGGLICIVLLIYIIGLFLPTERIVSRKGHFNTSPEVLYNIVADNNNWQYRTGLKDLKIIKSTNELEVWDEISEDGSSIRFRTLEKRPYSFYSFHMEAKMFTGYWTGAFESDEKGGTIFTATEHIRVHNPFIKTLSYLFFDVGKFMDSYQYDLQKKIESL